MTRLTHQQDQAILQKMSDKAPTELPVDVTEGVINATGSGANDNATVPNVLDPF